MEKSKLQGHAVLLFANIIFGANIIISKSLLPNTITPYTLTLYRLVGGMVLFWIASFFIQKETVPRKDILLFFFASIFSVGINQLPFFYALSISSPIDVSILVTILPIITMILSAIFVKEPITLIKAIGVIVGLLGPLLLIFTNEHLPATKSNVWGNLIIFSTVLSFAIYLTAFKSLIVRYSPITSMKWMMLFGSIINVPFCWKSAVETNYTTFGFSEYAQIAFILIVGTFISYMLLPIAQKRLRPTTLSMYNYLQPIVVSMMAVIIGMDNFGVEKVLSIVLVFSGVYIVTKSKSRAQVEAEKIVSSTSKK